MTTKTKWRIGCVAGGLIMAALLVMFVIAVGGIIFRYFEPAVVETQWKPRPHQAVTVSPTAPDPSPTPGVIYFPPGVYTPQDADTYVKNAIEKSKEQELRKQIANAKPPENPFEDDEAKGVRLRKHGFSLVDADGNEWGRVHRIDDEEITKGLYPSTIVLESATAKPIVTWVSDHWQITFELPGSGLL